MSSIPSKNYLAIAKQTRGILDANVPVNVYELENQIPHISKLRTKKDAYATTAFWLAVARSNGEKIPYQTITQLLNKLKGKNNRSQIQIRQIINNGMNLITGINPSTQKVKGILSGIEQDGIVESVAETVVNALTQNKGSTNSITMDQSGKGWGKFAVAVLVVLIAKFMNKRR